MKVKRYFLILAFVMVSLIALLYGVSPRWFASAFFGVAELDLNFAHILRAVMCLYLGFGLFWLYSAFSDKYRNIAILTIVIFASGLLIGRIFSLFVDGRPSPLLVSYGILELLMVPISYWIFKLPE